MAHYRHVHDRREHSRRPFPGDDGLGYLYGLAQANFEINAIFGILVAAFKNGFLVLMSAAVLLVKPSPKLVWYALFLSVALSLGLKWLVPDLAYFNRALLTIVLTFEVVAIPTVIQNGWRIAVRDLVQTASPNIGYSALGLGLSLIVVHVFFHWLSPLLPGEGPGVRDRPL